MDGDWMRERWWTGIRESCERDPAYPDVDQVRFAITLGHRQGRGPGDEPKPVPKTRDGYMVVTTGRPWTFQWVDRPGRLADGPTDGE